MNKILVFKFIPLLGTICIKISFLKRHWSLFVSDTNNMASLDSAAHFMGRYDRKFNKRSLKKFIRVS